MSITFYDPSNANDNLEINLLYTFKEQPLPKPHLLMKNTRAPCALRGQPNGWALSCRNVNFQNALNET